MQEPRQISHTAVTVDTGRVGKRRIVRLPRLDDLTAEVERIINRLLDRPKGCESFPLDLIPVEQASYYLGIGAVRGGVPTAKALRAQITTMARGSPK